MPQTNRETYFLRKVAQHLFQKHNNFQNIRVVLPGKRGALFLKKHLNDISNQPIFLPNFITLNELVEEKIKSKIISGNQLLFEFYLVHQKIEKKAEEFDNFIKWAPQLLSDFNEVDYYMIDSQNIFSDLDNLKTLDSWNVGEGELSDMQKQQLSFWNKISRYYDILNQQLYSKNTFYRGAAYRFLASNLNKLNDGYYYYFIGFNALTKTESILVDYFKSNNKGQVLWDADSFYVDNPIHEAGYFLRKEINSKFLWKSNDFKNIPKNITQTSVANNSSQVFAVENILDKIPAEEYLETAIILGDESILPSLLSVLPKKIEKVNVTMGYSLRYSLLSTFIEQIFLIQKEISQGKSIWFQLFLKWWTNSITSQIINKSKTEKLYRWLVKNNYNYFSSKQVLEWTDNNPLVSLVFSKWDNIKDDGIQTLKDILEIVLKTKTIEENIWLNEAALHYKKIIHELENILDSYSINISLNAFHTLFKKMISQESLSFVGEPLEGLQIMGLLESRTLDFKNLIILNVNEGVFPKQHSSSHYLPYELKKHYSLPTYKEHDAIFAYYFYRLLQRSTNVYLISNEEVGTTNSGEPSRYINQLFYELPIHQPKTNISKQKLNIRYQKNESSHLSIKKDKWIIDRLYAIAEKGFSPSSLAIYMNCPLDFYYKYVIGIKETDILEDSIAANTLGTIIHDILEALYLPYQDKIISYAEMDSMLKKADDILPDIYKQHYSKNYKTGKNKLIYKVIQHYISTYLNNQKKLLQNETFKLKWVETDCRVQVNIPNIQKPLYIKGKVDRTDIIQNKLRIIDYKTGKVNPSELKFDSMQVLAEENKRQKAFQLMSYLFMISKQSELAINEFEGGIISIRNSQQIMPLQFKESKIITTEDINLFLKDCLTPMIEEVLNPEIPFLHKENAPYCRFCDN